MKFNNVARNAFRCKQNSGISSRFENMDIWRYKFLKTAQLENGERWRVDIPGALVVLEQPYNLGPMTHSTICHGFGNTERKMFWKKFVGKMCSKIFLWLPILYITEHIEIYDCAKRQGQVHRRFREKNFWKFAPLEKFEVLRGRYRGSEHSTKTLLYQ